MRKKFVRFQRVSTPLVPADLDLNDARAIEAIAKANLPFAIKSIFKKRRPASLDEGVWIGGKKSLYVNLEISHIKTLTIIDKLMTVAKWSRKNG